MEDSEDNKGVNQNKVAQIRELDCMITIKALNKAKNELRKDITDILEKELLNESFAQEESIVAYVDQALDGNLTTREKDLIGSYCTDPGYR